MQRFYADLFFVNLPSVLGRKLLPLSLGHSFILSALDLDKHNLTTESVINIAWICSQPWNQATGKIADGTYKAECIEWGKKRDGLVKEEDFEAIEDYIDIYMSHPPSYESADKGKPVPVPWQLALVWVLMERMSEADAWNLPCNRAFAFSATNRYYTSLDGKTDLISEYEEEQNKLPFPELDEAQKEVLRKMNEAANGKK